MLAAAASGSVDESLANLSPHLACLLLWPTVSSQRTVSVSRTLAIGSWGSLLAVMLLLVSIVLLGLDSQKKILHPQLGLTSSTLNAAPFCVCATGEGTMTESLQV